jgi:hypothetical protein
LAQGGAVIGFIGEELSGWLGATDQGLGGWTIMRLTTAQQDGKKVVLRPPRERPIALFCSPLLRPMPSGVP